MPDHIALITHLLRDTYTPIGIRIWLHSRNRNLYLQRPVDLLRDGDVEAVLKEVDRITGGGGA